MGDASKKAKDLSEIEVIFLDGEDFYERLSKFKEQLAADTLLDGSASTREKLISLNIAMRMASESLWWIEKYQSA